MDVASLVVKADATDIKQLNKHLEELSKKSDKVEKDTKKMERGFGSMAQSLKSLMPVITAATAALAAFKVAGEIVRVARETEMFTARLKTATGSIQQAGIAFNRLNEFAKTTPFTLQQSIDGFIKLKALGLDPSERAMRSYGNTSAAMGKDMMQMIEAVADASTGEFERLKEFGIKAKQEGDRVSLTFQGVTTNIGKNSKEIQEYLLAIGETNFAGAMDDQMNTIDGQLSNLTQSFDDLWRTLGEGLGITELVRDLLKKVSAAVNTLNKFLRELFDLDAEFKKAKGSVTDAENAVAEFNSTLDITDSTMADVIDEVSKWHTKQKEANNMIEEAQMLFNQNIISLEELVYITDKYGKKNKQVTKNVTYEWQELNDNIQAEFINTFTDMLTGAEVSFKDFARSILKMWINTTANMVFNPQMSGSTLSGLTSGLISGGTGGYGNVLSLGNQISPIKLLPSIGDLSALGGSAMAGTLGATTSFMGAGAGASQAAMLASQTAAFGSAGTAMTTSALGGASLASSIGAAIPYIGLALMAGQMLGLFDDKDAKTTFHASSGVEGAFKHFNPNDPYGFLNKGRSYKTASSFGDISLFTHHASGKDGQMTPEQANQVMQTMATYLDALEMVNVSIINKLDLSTEQIQSITNAVESVEMEGHKDPEDFKKFITDRYTTISDAIGGEFDRVYDYFIAMGNTIEESIGSAIIYLEASNEIKQVYRELATDSSRTASEIVGMTNNLLAVNQLFESIGGTTSDLSGKSAKLATALIDVAGGIDNLANDLNYFYNNFFSSEERLQDIVDRSVSTRDELNALYGLDIQTKDDFKQLLATMSKEDIQKYYQDLRAMMIALNEGWGAFEELNKTVPDTTNSIVAITDTFTDLGKTANDASGDIRGLINSFKSNMTSIGNLRQGILNSKQQFGFKTNYDSLIYELNSQLTHGQNNGGDIQIHEQIRQAIVGKYQSEIEQIRNTGNARLEQLQEEQGYFESIKNFVRDLRVSDLSPLLQPQKTVEAGQNFMQLANAARGGDMNALSQLQGSAQTYLENARTQFASSGQYSAIFGTVEAILNEFSNRTNYTNYENAQLDIDNLIAEKQQEAIIQLDSLDMNVGNLQTVLINKFDEDIKAYKEGNAELKQEIKDLKEEIARQNAVLIAANKGNTDQLARLSNPSKISSGFKMR